MGTHVPELYRESLEVKNGTLTADSYMALVICQGLLVTS